MITTEFVACKCRANAGNSMNREQGAKSRKQGVGSGDPEARSGKKTVH